MECLYGGKYKKNRKQWLAGEGGALKNSTINRTCFFWKPYQEGNTLRETEQRVMQCCKKQRYREDSGQDGGVGRNPSPPRTTKRRTTTNLKSINHQKCQKTAWNFGNQGIKENQSEQPDW